ncbi:hypothetical protein [Streptomyces sp. NPDC046805]|uniref:hypothetical protein n=1 Tax=Streptomyces sp. NPDC046805 TaxID=3155134 RepID=UPI0033E78778
MGAIVLVVGIVCIGAVIAAVTVFAVIRSRRTSANSGPFGGTYPQNTGYPPQQPMYAPAQQPYPNSAPNQWYPAPQAKPQQMPNPYTQQPRYQGQ